MTEYTLTAVCALCDEEFEARTTYGICPSCFDRDKLREFDRLESAKRHAKRAHLPIELTLTEWIATISDFNAKCAYCLTVPFGYLEMVDPLAGLTKKNVVPVCKACQVHKQHSFASAEHRVRAYLDYDPSVPVPLPERSVIALGEIFPGFDTWYHNRLREQQEDEEE